MKKALILFIVVLSVSCSKRDLPQTPTFGEPVLELKRAPEVLSPGFDYRVEVSVQSENRVDSVKLSMLTNGHVIAAWYLYDDGGAVHAGDGDIAAFDGVYTQIIQYSAVSDRDQELLWQFTARDNTEQESQTLEWSLTGLANPNTPPEIIDVKLPEDLPSGFSDNRSIQVTAADSNGLNDLKRISYIAYLDDRQVFQGSIDSTVTPGLYEQNLTAEYASGKRTGDYRFVFRALDQSDAASEPVTRNMLIYNNPPLLEQPVHTDSVLRPQQGTRTNFLISVKVLDDQGIDDIRRVWMKWQKADGTFPGSGPYFDLFDNGLDWNEDFSGWDQGARGDEVADDGVYSIMGTFDSQQPLGEYTFTFYALDFAGNSSDSTVSHLMLYTQED